MSGVLWIMCGVALVGMYAAFRWGYEVACQDHLGMIADGRLTVREDAMDIQPSKPWPLK